MLRLHINCNTPDRAIVPLNHINMKLNPKRRRCPSHLSFRPTLARLNAPITTSAWPVSSAAEQTIAPDHLRWHVVGALGWRSQL